MSHATTETSIRAYRALSFEQVSHAQRQILEAMDYGRLYTRRELEKLAGMRICSICGRVKELLDKGWLEIPGEKKCPESGNMVEALTLAPRQRELI